MTSNILSFQALTWAASKGHIRVVQILLENGADFLKKTVDGSKAADIAFANGEERVSVCFKIKYT